MGASGARRAPGGGPTSLAAGPRLDGAGGHPIGSLVLCRPRRAWSAPARAGAQPPFLRPRRGPSTHEANVSPPQSASQEDARLPGADEEQGGQEGALGAPEPGPEAPHRLLVLTTERRERITLAHRLRDSREIESVKAEGSPLRGAHCLLLVLPRPAEPTRIGFIASRKGVGGAVQRNRARRRLREIVRRRWPRLPDTGYWMLLIAHRGVLAAPHQELASEIERLLAAAGALAPLGTQEA
jgi:ribonuclease P protein component